MNNIFFEYPAPLLNMKSHFIKNDMLAQHTFSNHMKFALKVELDGDFNTRSAR